MNNLNSRGSKHPETDQKRYSDTLQVEKDEPRLGANHGKQEKNSTQRIAKSQMSRAISGTCRRALRREQVANHQKMHIVLGSIPIEENSPHIARLPLHHSALPFSQHTHAYHPHVAHMPQCRFYTRPNPSRPKGLRCGQTDRGEGAVNKGVDGWGERRENPGTHRRKGSALYLIGARWIFNLAASSLSG